MTTVSISSDLIWDSGSLSLTGQTPYKKISEIEIIGNWKLTDKLNDLKIFEFTVPNDEFHKENVLVERNIAIPALTTFDGIITEKSPEQDNLQFMAKENAWHLNRIKYSCHDIKRISYTQKNWYNKSWKFRRIIETDSHQIQTSQSELTSVIFPFSITDPELKVHALSDGRDILFVEKNSDGVLVKLDHEIESYDQSTGKLVAFIRFPIVHDDDSMEFHMYFGNPSASNQQNKTGVWDTQSWNGIWHLNTNSLDSTTNANNGTDTSITRITGVLFNGAYFNGTNSKIDTASGSSIDNIFAASGGGHFSCWFQAKSDGGGDNGRIADKVEWSIRTMNETGGQVRLRFEHQFSGNDGQWDTAINLDLNEFYKLDVIYDNTSASNKPIIYIDGLARIVGNGLTETTTPTSTASSDAASSLIIGNNTGQTATFHGVIDEVEIRKTPQIGAENIIRMQQSSITTTNEFYVIGQVEFYLKSADEIAENIIRGANEDMPILNVLPISNLVSLYRLDGDVIDVKGAHNGSWTGTELYTNGFFRTDRAAKLDGSSRITLIDETSFDYEYNTPFSISLLVKVPDSGSEQILFAKKTDTSSSTKGYSIAVTTADVLEFKLCDGTTNFTVTGTRNIRDNEWHTITCTYAGGSDRSGMKIYIDDFLEASGTSATISISITNNLNITFGAGNAGASPLTGVLDDIRIYNKELTEKEVQHLDNSTQSDIDIIKRRMQWKLGDGHVTTIDNLLSLHKFDQNLLDTKSDHYCVIESGLEKYILSKYGTYGFSFNGSTNLRIQDETIYDFERTSTFSASFWFKGINVGTNESLIDKFTTLGYKIAFNTSNNLVITFSDGTLTHTWTYTTQLRDGAFHLITMTSAGTGATGVLLYIDGALVSISLSGTYPTATILNDVRVSLGSTNALTNYLTGTIDDLRFYSDILTYIEVKRIFEATDSGIDRIRDDNISTKLLEIDFNHKTHFESLKKIATELGTDLYFDSSKYNIFIRIKGKTVSEKFEKFTLIKPTFSLEKVANIVNVLGDSSRGIQREKTFETDSAFKYNYEESFADNQITTDDSMNLVGTTISDQLKDLNPELTLNTTYDQYVKFDLNSGDKIELNESAQDIKGIFRITRLEVTPETCSISLNKSEKSLIQTSGNSIGDIFGQLVKAIQDIQIVPEQ